MKKLKFNAQKLFFAVDYGTSNSLLAATDGLTSSQPLPLDPEASDATVLRSLLYFPDQNSCFYGQAAIDRYCDNHAAGRLIRSIKKYLPVESFRGTWIEDRVVRLEDLIGYFLLEMKKRACEQLDTDVDSILLGRPALFSPDPAADKLAQYRLEKAAQFAGFKNIQFFPEPLAAAFDLRRQIRTEKIVLVVDLGGGTSDFTVIRISAEAFKNEDVLSMGGVSLAGDAIDGDFMKYRLAPFFGSKVKYRVPLSSGVMTMPPSLLDHICSPADIAQLSKHQFMGFFKQLSQWSVGAKDKEALHRLFVLVEDQLGFQLFEEIDKTKRSFSEQDEVEFYFDYPEIDIREKVFRSDFHSMILGSCEKILGTMDEVLKSSGLNPEQIDVVYTTGGTSKLELVRRELLKRFGPEKIMNHDNLFHSVIQGLTARASELAQEI